MAPGYRGKQMQKSNAQTCCFTGHRIIPEKDYPILREHLVTEIANLIRQGVNSFLAGGALGFDTMAAQAVLDLKMEYPHIRLILVLPCKSQTRGWNERDIKIYDRILHEADQVVFTSENYHRGCMAKRNRYLVDNSSVCVCYLCERKGGTAYTVQYAKQKGLRIIQLPASHSGKNRETIPD